MKNKVLSLFALFLLMVGISSTASAVPISDISDPLLTGSTLLDFNSVALEDGFSSKTIGELTITNTGNMRISNDNNGEYTPPQDSFLDNKYGGDFTFSFVSEIGVFGVQIGATNVPWTLSAYDSGNNLLESLGIPNQVGTQPYPYTGYYGLGFGSDVISYITLSHGGDDWIVLDDIQYGGGNPVPEPATMLLLGLGLIGIAGARRKLKK